MCACASSLYQKNKRLRHKCLYPDTQRAIPSFHMTNDRWTNNTILKRQQFSFWGRKLNIRSSKLPLNRFHHWLFQWNRIYIMQRRMSHLLSKKWPLQFKQFEFEWFTLCPQTQDLNTFRRNNLVLNFHLRHNSFLPDKQIFEWKNSDVCLNILWSSLWLN